MRAVGLITEYNPFHNGHLYHLQQSKLRADAEVAVAVMSGNFLQRGEAALCDKWRRTEMALAAGVDLVVELPFLFACNSAPHFALGAVRSLDALGGIGALCFGSEAGQLEPLQQCAALLSSRSREIEAATRQLLRKGLSYPAARAAVVPAMQADRCVAEVLKTPNNILGIEYLKSLSQTGSAMKALTIQRIGAGYHAVQGEGGIASATGIRHLLQRGEEIDSYLPPQVARLVRMVLLKGESPDPALFLRLLLARLVRGPESCATIYQLESGLENRLCEAALRALTLEDLIDGLKARQLTRTRVQRMLCYLLNEVEQALAEELLHAGPLYLHLLGCSAAGEQFLSRSRKQRRLPLVSNYSRISSQLQRFYGRESRGVKLAQAQLQLELRSSANYALLQKGFSARRQGDFYEPVRRFS